MYCVLKDYNTFRTIPGTTCSVTDYDLVLESIYDETSDVTLTGMKTKPRERDFVYLENGYQGIVSEVAPAEKAWKLSCRQMVTLFDRDIFYEEPQGATAEARLKHMIDSNFTNQADDIYRLPYLRVVAETATAADVKPDIEDGIYNIKAFIAKLRRLYHIFVTFEMKKDVLVVRIAKKIIPTKQLDFSDEGYRISEQAFSCERIGRITTRAEDTGETAQWYLLQDGTIVNAYTAENRVDGEWKLLNVREAQEAAEAVKDEFLSNSYSHNISFTAKPEKARFSFCDGLEISMEGRLFSSYIAAVKISKKNRLTEYQCGELRTTFPLKKLL